MHSKLSSFSLAALASGSTLLTVLDTGSARASIHCTFGTLNSCNGTEGNLIFSNFAATGIDSSNTIAIFQVGSSYIISTSFILGGALTTNAQYSFTVATTSGYIFNTAAVDSSTAPNPTDNGVFTYTFTNLPASPLVSTAGNPAGPASFSTNKTTTSVVANWLANNSAAAASDITLNLSPFSAQVPSPVPLFGAVTAFGIFRKLRRRIRASS